MQDILFISSYINPFEKTVGGSAQRTNLLLRACSEIGNVDVVVFRQNAVSNIQNCKVIYSKNDNNLRNKETRLHKFLRLLKPWNPYSSFQKDYYNSEIVHEIINKKLYDLIVIRYIPRAMECGLLDYAEKLVIDVDDLPHDAIRSLSKNARTYRNRIWLSILSKMAKGNTRQILEVVKFSFFSNPSQVNLKNSAYLPNIPFYQNFTCPNIDFNKTEERLFLIGDLDYYPNYLGVTYFIENIYVKIQQRIPEVKFYIAGRISRNDLKNRWESYKGVCVLGFVDDLLKLYSESRVVVVPIYHGAGTNIKLPEALQMNRACVVTEFASRGFNDILENKKDYFIAYNDNEFIGYTTELLTNEKKNKLLAYNGNLKIKQNFSYSLFSNIVKSSLSNSVASKK